LGEWKLNRRQYFAAGGTAKPPQSRILRLTDTMTSGFGLLRKDAAVLHASTDLLKDPAMRLGTAAVLAASFVLFLAVRQSTHYIAFPDENFDYMEQAYRVVHGYGTPTWTYELGMRSWIFPGLLAGAMWIGSLFGGNERLFAHGLVAASSLIPVWCAIQWARWLGIGRLALLAGILTATWVDTVYWSSVTLSEIVTGNLFCLCIHQAFCFVRGGDERRLVLLGLGLGLVFAIRFQFALFLLLLALLVCRMQPRRWLLVIAGGLAVALLSGLLDWVTLGRPFQSIWLNLWVNAKVPIAEYGMVNRPLHYLTDLQLSYWSWAALPLLLCAAAGLALFPGLGVLSAAIWIFHSLLSNQQIRFLYPAVILIVIAAAIGVVRLVHRYRDRVPGWLSASLPAAIALLWAGTSVALALHGSLRPKWVHRMGNLALADYVRTHPDICGLVTSDKTAPVFGQSFIGRPIPLYEIVPQDGLAKLMPYVNALALSETETAPSDYQAAGCWRDGYDDVLGKHPSPKVCLYRRAGACTAGAPEVTDPWPPSALQFRRFAVSPPDAGNGQ